MTKIAAIACCSVLGLAAAVGLARPAAAADLAAPVAEAVAVPSVIDVAFGVAGLTDYRFRGVSNSAKDPAIQGYAEIQAFDWVYAGIWSSSVSFPNRFGLTDPSSEIDLYAGIRHTWGAFTLDAGYLYYWYPGETKGLRQTDYWELKALPSVAIGDIGTITGNIWWSPDYANTGASDLYLSVVPKINIPVSSMPDVGFYISGEIGKQWLGKTDDLPVTTNLKNFWTWNVGGGMTYKAMTLDVRYSDTTLSKNDCVVNTGVRNWCGSTVVGKIAFDTSLNKLK